MDGGQHYRLTSYVTLYVNVNGTGGPLDGRSWTTAYHLLWHALAEAGDVNGDSDPANDGSQIWVAKGDYPLSTFPRALLSDVSIYGGFDGTETSRAQRNRDPLTNATRLLGRPTTNARIMQAVNVTDARLDGFTLQDGFTSSTIGDALLLQFGEVTLENLLFFNNHATGNIGGALVIDGGDYTFINCTFT